MYMVVAILPGPFANHGILWKILSTMHLFCTTKSGTENGPIICHQVPNKTKKGHQKVHSFKSKDHIGKFHSIFPLDVNKNLVPLLVKSYYCIWLTSLFCQSHCFNKCCHHYWWIIIDESMVHLSKVAASF